MLRNGEAIPKGSGTIARIVATKWKKLDAVARCQYEYKAQVERNIYNLDQPPPSHDLQVALTNTAGPINDAKSNAPISVYPSFEKEKSPISVSPSLQKENSLTMSPVIQPIPLKQSNCDVGFLQFQKQVSLSLKESPPDKDFVEFILSLEFV